MLGLFVISWNPKNSAKTFFYKMHYFRDIQTLRYILNILYIIYTTISLYTWNLKCFPLALLVEILYIYCICSLYIYKGVEACWHDRFLRSWSRASLSAFCTKSCCRKFVFFSRSSFLSQVREIARNARNVDTSFNILKTS